MFLQIQKENMLCKHEVLTDGFLLLMFFLCFHFSDLFINLRCSQYEEFGNFARNSSFMREILFNFELIVICYYIIH